MLTYVKIEGIPKGPEMKNILNTYEQIFKSDSGGFVEEMKEKRGLVTFAAMEDQKMVGFKMGYDRKKDHFYSWIGGVIQEHRGKGVASEMMHLQHEWCRNHGYSAIRTQTKNKWKDMLILNLRHDYHVIGTYITENNETKIMLEKRFS
ncbi:MAG TPA: GNAT family N-acetyltransferase [Bacillales bacterium]|nr:GNAT family N-acetyltransferase [Bacillales bacterium]